MVLRSLLIVLLMILLSFSAVGAEEGSSESGEGGEAADQSSEHAHQTATESNQTTSNPQNAQSEPDDEPPIYISILGVPVTVGGDLCIPFLGNEICIGEYVNYGFVGTCPSGTLFCRQVWLGAPMGAPMAPWFCVDDGARC